MIAAPFRIALIGFALSSFWLAACGNNVQNNSGCTSTSCADGQSCIAGSCVPTVTQAGAPTGVTASASGLTANLSWTAPTDNGGADITGYVVTTSPGGGTTNSVDTNVNVPSLVSGTTYRFTVHAVTSFGAGVESAPSAPLLIGTAVVAAKKLTLTTSPAMPEALFTPVSFTVSATDASGTTAVGYLGTIHFTEQNGSGEQLPADYTFTSADAGTHTFIGIIFSLPGVPTIVVTDAANNFSAFTSVDVLDAPTVGYQFTVPQMAYAGLQFEVMVSALDPSGAVNHNDESTIVLGSSDPLVAPVMLALDNGEAVFNFTLFTGPSQTLTATSADQSAATTSSPIAVDANVVATIKLDQLSSATPAGAQLSPRVMLFDAYNNLIDAASPQITFTSSDPQATLPAPYALDASEEGVHIYSNQLILGTAGAQTVTATTTNQLSATATVNVSPLIASTYKFTGLGSPSIAGDATQQLKLSAIDLYGNIDPTYLGKVHFTSSDAQAALPPDTQFSASDLGTHAFAAGAVVLDTAGAQTLSATDIAASTKTGSITLQVLGAAADGLALTGPSTVTYAQAAGLTLTVLDRYGNPATNYAGGEFNLSTSAAGVSMPASVAVNAGQSSMQFLVTISAIESNVEITATDASAQLAPTTLIIQAVEPQPANQLLFVASCEMPQAGISCTYTVTPQDRYNNIDTNYSGTVEISSSDSSAVSSTDHLTFSPVAAGAPDTMQFTFTFHQIGAQTVQVFDGNVAAAIYVQVSSGPVAQYVIDSGFPATSSAGTSFTMVIEALDSSGNLITKVTQDEQLSFAASDPGVTLPPAGTYTFSYGYINPSQTIVLRKSGLSTITVTDALGNSGRLSTTVTANGPIGFQASNVSSTVVAGAPVAAMLSAIDQYGNVATSLTSPIAIVSSDPQATGPVYIQFTAGVASLSSAAPQLQFQTAGTQTFTIDNPEYPTYPNYIGPSIAVTAGAPGTVTLSGFPSSVPVGAESSFAVAVADAYGNPVSGSLSLTSTDTGAVFTPDIYIFSSSDSGLHQFTNGVTFSEGGSVITVTGVITNSQGVAQGSAMVNTE